MNDRDALANAEAITLLREVLDELRALPAAIAAAVDRSRPQHLSIADRKMFTALLPVTAAATGERPFFVHMLYEHAELDTEATRELRDALASIGSSRRVGRLLRRGANQEINGFRIVVHGAGRNGTLWRVFVTGGNSKTRAAGHKRAT